jgi:hypothetical protein
MTTQPANDIESAVQRLLVHAWKFAHPSGPTVAEMDDFKAAIRAELGRAPAEPAGAYTACEDCDGRGVVGEEIYQGEFQPPEREQCGSCNGSGRWKIDATTTPAEPAQQAPSGQQAEGRPTDTGLFAWVPEHGTPSIVVVDRRPSAYSPGNVLNGHVIGGSTFYDGCAITSWPEKQWINLRPALAANQKGD